MSTLVRGGAPSLNLDDAVIEVEGTAITGVTSAVQWELAMGQTAPKPQGTIWPGLIDLHCHGGGGYTFCTTDQTQALAAADHHARHGTTSVMASLVTAPAEVLLDQVRALAPLVADGHLLGVHLEGPFLSPTRRGAQDPRYLIDPDTDLMGQLLKAGEGAITVVTLAPERPGAAKLMAMLREAGVTVALGHTDATYEVMREAIDWLAGTALVTHLANGMPPLDHRASGPVGAALVAAAQGAATVELISDGVHVDQGFAALTFATVAPGHAALITDAMAAAGMPDGEYDLGPQRVRVKDGVAKLTVGDSLAGGTSHLAEDVTRTVSATTQAAALAAATTTPARVLNLGQARGTIAPGARADLFVQAPDGTRSVMRNGGWLPRT